jgi:hypothetical protein
MINGVFCHETGCPNSASRYDVETDQWVKVRTCHECGYTCDADDPCCNFETLCDGLEDDEPEDEYTAT